MPELHIGTNLQSQESFHFDSELLKYHIALLGATGSGKTVAAKVIIEEAAMAGIPSIIVDPQGDLGRLAMLADFDEIRENGGDVELAKKFSQEVEVRIWTPTKKSGLPLSINPFKPIPKGMDEDDKTTWIDVMAGGFALLAGYNSAKEKTKQIRAYLNELLTLSVENNALPQDFADLANFVGNPLDLLEEWNREDKYEELSDGYISSNDIKTLSRRIRTLKTGVNKLLFSSGVPLDIDLMRTPSKDGLVPINIIHMKSLEDVQNQQNFLLELSRSIYSWMMKLNAEDESVKLLYFIDEVSPYLPPSKNPPAKDMIKLLFKQGRKYGVSCALATQNLKDVDYTILSQAKTKLFGGIVDGREINILKKEFTSASKRDNEKYINMISSAKKGEFLFHNPEVSKKPIQIKTRWLYTDHGLPLNEEHVEKLTTKELRAWAEKLSSSPDVIQPVAEKHLKENKGAKKTNHEETQLDEITESNLDDIEYDSPDGNKSTVEINLLGGLSVLQNTKDPLHMMLSLTNIITAFAFLFVEISLFENWNDGRISIMYPMLGLGLAILCGGVFAAESIMRDHSAIVQSIRKRARPLQMLVLAWTWILYLLPNFTEIVYNDASRTSIIVAQTLVTVFFVTDIVHRFQLKKIDLEFGTSIIDTAKKSAKILIDALHLKKIESSSEIILRNIRMISDGLAIYILLVLLDVFPALSVHTEYDILLRIFSLMSLNFITELLIRLRT